MEQEKKKLRDIQPLNFLFLTVAGIVNATGVTLFLTPVSLYDGGFSGTSFFLSQLTPLSLSVFLIILNFPFFVLGFKKLGVPFIIYSLYTIAVYSLFAWLYQSVFDLDFSVGSPIAGNEKLLCAIFGGIISGIGSGMTIRFGGAIDGIEVLGVMFAKRINISIGTFVMIYNVILYIIAGFVMGTQTNHAVVGWELSLYSIIAYACGLKAVDFVVDGFDKAKSAFIISEKNQEIAQALSEVFGRGVTVLEAEGYYSKSNKTIIYCVINRFEVSKLKEIVQKIDAYAFLAINDVTDSMSKNLAFGLKRKRIEKSNEMRDMIVAHLKKTEKDAENTDKVVVVGIETEAVECKLENSESIETENQQINSK